MLASLHPPTHPHPIPTTEGFLPWSTKTDWIFGLIVQFSLLNQPVSQQDWAYATDTD